MPPLKIAQVSLHPDYGGCERHVLLLSLGLRDSGQDVTLFCHPDGELFREATKAGLAVRAVRGSSQMDPRAAVTLARKLRRLQPDVVHLHTARDCVGGPFAARLAHAPVLVFTRHTLFPIKPQIRHLYNTGDAVICLAHTARSFLETQGLHKEKLVHLNGAIDTRPYLHVSPASRAQVQSEWNLTRGQIAVGTVGRLAPSKGHDTFLQAVAQLVDRAEIRFFIIGDGPLRTALENEATRLGIADRVLFTGSRADIPAVCAALDVIVSPSHSELLPLTIMEAHSAGRAVVATQVGGVPELIENEVSGLLVSPRDAPALGQAVERLVGDTALRSRLAQAGQRQVDRYDFSRLVRETETLYERLCKSKVRSPQNVIW